MFRSTFVSEYIFYPRYEELVKLGLVVSVKYIASIQGLNGGRRMQAFEVLFMKVFQNLIR